MDYNIFLISRIREERAGRDTGAAIEAGLRHTGGVITSAGLILAGTFAVLMALPVESFFQAGFTIALGILVDTFAIRVFLVPASLCSSASATGGLGEGELRLLRIAGQKSLTPAGCLDSFWIICGGT